VKDIISPKRNCLAADSTILDEWSANLTLPDYGRVARDSTRIRLAELLPYLPRIFGDGLTFNKKGGSP